jgi:hypothetical protein
MYLTFREVKTGSELVVVEVPQLVRGLWSVPRAEMLSSNKLRNFDAEEITARNSILDATRQRTLIMDWISVDPSILNSVDSPSFNVDDTPEPSRGNTVSLNSLAIHYLNCEHDFDIATAAITIYPST